MYEDCSLVKKEGRTSGVIDVVVSSGLTGDDERRNAALEEELGKVGVAASLASAPVLLPDPSPERLHGHAEASVTSL